jgi:PAS domain S-box-containing protein
MKEADHTELILKKGPSGKITYVSSSLAEFIGVSANELLGSTYQLPVHDEDKEFSAKAFARLKEPPHACYVEQRVKTPQGWRWVAWHHTLINKENEEGPETLYLGRDITEEKEAVQELEEKKERLDHILKGTNVGTWEWDIKTGETILNEKWANIIGYTLEEIQPTTFKTWEQFAHPEDLKVSDEYLQKIFAGELDYYEVECRMRHKEGHWVWVLDRGAVSKWDEEGNPKYMSGTHQDITKRKKAEASLKQRDSILSAMGYAADLLLKRTDLNSLDKMLEEFGKASDASRSYIFEVYEEDGVMYTSQRLEWSAPGIESQIDNQEMQHVTFDEMGIGRWEGILASGEPVSSLIKDLPEGEQELLTSQDIQSILVLPIFVGDDWWGFIGFDQCEKEKKWSSIEVEALRAAANIFGTALQRVQSEEQLRLQSAALDSAANAMYITNREGELEWINPAWTRMTGYTREEAIGQNNRILKSGVHGEEFYKDLWNTLLSGKVWSGELVNRKKSGEEYYEMQTITPLLNKQGVVTHFIGFKQDITDRKKAENELKKSLQEKETLLAEIHHRVKNNLAVVSGMMQLQAQHSDDQELKDELFNSVTRIKTIASVHELLYQSESFTHLSFSGNIRRLLDQLSSTLDVGKEIQVSMDGDEVMIDVSQALPASLIANEVITNAFKHAFEGRESGQLEISLTENEDEVTLIMKDDGVGFDYETSDRSSLGLQLIHILTLQLEGEHHFENTGEGTLFTLRFMKAKME